MPEPQYSPNHVINQETGYVENPAYINQFDSERKEQFLSLYKSNGIRLRRACREMGLSEATVSRHLHTDPLFKEKFEEVERDYIEDLESVSRVNALNPRSVIERIFQLKCILPNKYGQENKPQSLNVTISLDPNMLNNAANRLQSIDAEIISSTQAEVAKQLDNQPPKSATKE